MKFYVFPSLESAEKAQAKIVANVRGWLAANAPDALTPDANGVRGRNALSGGLVDVATVRWATPQLASTGKWVFEKPTQEKTSPIPVEVFLDGIVATESDYSKAWFPETSPW